MPDVDGILCATDMLAIGCMQELKAHGIAVPEQVAVIGVDNTLYGQLCTPALTTLDNKLGEVSLAAGLENAQRETRRYAKRQATWLRGQMADWPRIDAVAHEDQWRQFIALTPALTG